MYYYARSLFFQKAVTWQGENEARSIIVNLPEQVDIDSRKLKYKLEHLGAIVFGAKTSALEKYNVVHIIHDKCRPDDLEEFKFYQAFLAILLAKWARLSFLACAIQSGLTIIRTN
ncbi:hypothetical protein [Pseudomonas batumici]|uniref:hypothetical protein n=1 Tax=Pseudomonas batumici TaxID=226910 RepID=UPI00058A22A8|nr:hypothetical protein [Pseudomonas batumici]